MQSNKKRKQEDIQIGKEDEEIFQNREYNFFLWIFYLHLKNRVTRDSMLAQLANPPPPSTDIHLGTSLCPGCSTFHPITCLWPGITAETGSVPCSPSPLWEIWTRLLSPDFWSAKFWALWPFREWTIGRDISLSLLCLLSVYYFSDKN